MVSDRQQKFYVRIGLLTCSTNITAVEKKNLERAKKWLDRGDELPLVVNSLCLGLKSIKDERLQGSLSPAVDWLYKDLIEAYGEPVENHYLLGESTFRGVSHWFFAGGIGMFIIALLVLSTQFLSGIIASIGKTATIFLYAAIFIIAILIMVIPGRKGK